MTKVCLKINELIIDAKIGVPEEERLNWQKIAVNVEIHWSKNDLGEIFPNDELENSICYDEICQKIIDYAKQNEIKTIEFFAKKIYLLINKMLKNGQHLKICVTKLAPPINGLKNGASIIIEN